MKVGIGKLTPREKLLLKWNPCPGFIGHQHPRQEILFDHYVKRPYTAWRVYWRLHPIEAHQCGIR
jgi:hypothetical protein